MFRSVKEAIFAVAPYAPVLPFLIGLIRFRSLTVPLKVIAIHVFIAALVEQVATVMWYYRINNLFLLHLYTLEECGLILLFYSYVLRDFIKPRVFLYVFLFFLAFSIFNTAFLQSVTRNNTFARSIEAVIVIMCAVAFFYRMLGETRLNDPARSPYFWINTGFLVYFCGALLLFTLSNYIRGPQHQQLRMDVWTLHAFFSILLYIFIAAGLWKHRRT